VAITHDHRISSNKAIRSGFVLLLLYLLSFPGASAADLPVMETVPPGLNTAPISLHPDHRFTEEGPVLVFFYNTNCGDCLKILPYIQQFVGDHPELECHLLDIRESNAAWQLFNDYKDAFGTGPIPVPSLFVGDRALVGYDEIVPLLDEAVQSQRGGAVSTIIPSPTQAAPPNTGSLQQSLNLPLVVTAGLVDGINPCAFSVLIILLFTLTAAGSRTRMLTVGVCYISTVFLFYFFSGLGLFYVIQSAEISRFIGIIAAAIAIVLGVVSFHDAFRKDEKQSLAIPASRKGIIERYIQMGSVPAALILGVLVGMFELPCTGGIYLAILSLISDQTTLFQGIPLLLIYNVFFVLPLVLILAAVAWGLPLERVDRWRRENRRAVRVVMGIILIGLGVFLISTFMGG